MSTSIVVTGHRQREGTEHRAPEKALQRLHALVQHPDEESPAQPHPHDTKNPF